VNARLVRDAVSAHELANYLHRLPGSGCDLIVHIFPGSWFGPRDAFGAALLFGSARAHVKEETNLVSAGREVEVWRSDPGSLAGGEVLGFGPQVMHKKNG
jgi:hypothetical protein